MAELLIYDVIGAGFFDEGTTAATVRDQLDSFGGDDVLVRINSPGGDVFDGIAIKNVLDSYDGAVTIRVDGLAASAASVIALAGDAVAMADGAMLMIHDPWTVTVGDAADHETTVKALDKIGESLAGMYAKATGDSADAMRELMRAETWLTAEEAIEMGLADSAIETVKAQACKIPAAFGYKKAPKTGVLPPAAQVKALKTEPQNRAELAARIRQRKIDLTRATRTE